MKCHNATQRPREQSRESKRIHPLLTMTTDT